MKTGTRTPRAKRAKNLSLVIGATLMAAFFVIALIGPSVWGDEAEKLGEPGLPMSGQHWFGTDRLGRDVFAETMVATRLTLGMTLGAAALAALAGIALGTAIWVAGPKVRQVGLRLIDVMISYPAVILALVLVAILGPSATTSVIAIGAATCPAFARLTANLVASIADRDLIWSARLLGVPKLRLLRRHLLPNVAEPLLVLTSVAFSVSLKALSGLSFLGLGPASYDWGHLLNLGLQDIYTTPVTALGPAAAIVAAGLAGGLIGDGLAARLDPRTATLTRLRRLPKAVDVSHEPAAAVVSALDVVRGDGVKLVDGVSFRVGAGEVVGLVGESGSGKSLTAMALAQLLPEGLTAEASQLTAAGLDLRGEVERPALATRIGIVYQDPGTSFNPTLRIGSQVTEVVRVHAGLSRSAATARAIEQLEQVRITEPARRMKQYPHELSGGMRQRAMIASALLSGPRLLIADEPTTALDVTVQAEVLDLLREANKRDGTAVLLISHDIGVVSAICERVVVMYAGRVVEELTGEQLRSGEARHPYTKALLAATPRSDSTVDGELATIAGRPPLPGQRPAGCAFEPRCGAATGICQTAQPSLIEDVACHAVNGAVV
jgi:peptide/nickel transport system permease protein